MPRHKTGKWVVYHPEDSRVHHEGLYWSDDYGWTVRREATVYRAWEKETIVLPEGGEWRRFVER